MRLLAKTLYGLENILAEELSTLGAKNIKIMNRAVAFIGNKEVMYKVNYLSRTALSVLMPIAEFSISSKQDLYNQCVGIEWAEYLSVDSTFAIVPVVHSDLFPHTGYPALVVKDAIADSFRRTMGKRPSVNIANPTISINLHISRNRVTLSLDSSGLPLFKRGYREQHGEASLNEVLAAGMLKLAGYNGNVQLLDPMCGSGTILIEAAMIAANIPAGKYRKNFGFCSWQDYDEGLFRRIKNQADRQVKTSETFAPIFGSDNSSLAARAAKANIESAGLQDMIKVKICDIRDIDPFAGSGIIVTNPPYDKRVEVEDIDELYKTLGTIFKHRFTGSEAWVITSDKSYLYSIGLKHSARYQLFNGQIECLFAGYKLY